MNEKEKRVHNYNNNCVTILSNITMKKISQSSTKPVVYGQILNES